MSSTRIYQKKSRLQELRERLWEAFLNRSQNLEAFNQAYRDLGLELRFREEWNIITCENCGVDLEANGMDFGGLGRNCPGFADCPVCQSQIDQIGRDGYCGQCSKCVG